MSASTAPSAFPEHRLYTISDTDHTAYIVIGTALGIAFLPIFVFIRYAVRKANGIGSDDILILSSGGIAIVQSAGLLSACSHGLGQATSQVAPDRVASAEKVWPSSLSTGPVEFLQSWHR